MIQKNVNFQSKASSSMNQDNNQVLILNSENVPNQLPRNFRMCQNGWNLRSLFSFSSRIGLEELKASGSAQFSANGFAEILKHIPSKNIVIIDLRQESHGFANGIAISWYGPHNAANANKTLFEIECDERHRLDELVVQKNIVINQILAKPEDIIEKVSPLTIVVEKAYTEQKLVQDLGFRYIRMPVVDHLPPTKERVEQFVNFVKALSPNSWLHFHCAAGKGRTTTFMAMYDMMHNADKVSFEAIIKRQHLIGGKNLAELPDKSKWRYPHAVRRKNFLKAFYEKCRNDLIGNLNISQSGALSK